MSNTIITVVGYPDTFSFITRKDLPNFKFDCPVRRKILHKKMNELQIDSPCHLYSDYGIDRIEKKYGQEFWYLGS